MAKTLEMAKAFGKSFLQEMGGVILIAGFLKAGRCWRGEGNWGTLRIPREDWGTLGNIKED